MQRDDKLQHVYERLQALNDEKEVIKNKVLYDSKYTKKQYTADIGLLLTKKAYLEERLKLLLGINATLKMIKNDPKTANDFKIVEDPKQWEIFKNNLKDYQWIPFEGEICDFCGRTQTSTTSIAAAVLPSGKLDIICSRCFENELKNKTLKRGDVDATS